MKKVLFLMLMSCGLAATVVAGDTFYWTANRRQWASYSDPANWSLNKDSYSNPDSRIPTSADTIWNYGELGSGDYGNYLGDFELGGGSYAIAGFSIGSGAGKTWKSYQVHLTNGTFSVLDPASPSGNTSHGYYVWDSATLKFPATGTSALIGASGLEEQLTIKKGGLMEWRKGCVMFSTAISIENGGEMVFAPESFDVHAGAQNPTQNHYCRLTNRGTLHLPNGLIWSGSNTGNSFGKSFVVRQNEGILHIGGDFTKTTESSAQAAKFIFEFNGGTIVATNAVAFRNATILWGQEVLPSMPNNASGNVEVCADSVLDMQLFEYGTGTTLTKTGPGTLVIGASRPTSLAVNAGSLRLAAATADLTGITIANGTRIEFAAPNNNFAAPANYATLDFAVDVTSDAMQSGRTIFTSSDATFFAHVKSCVEAHLPAGYGVRQDGTSLILLKASSTPVFESNGELDLTNAAGWGGEAPASGADVTVSGPNTVALVSATPAYNSITVSDGATVKVTGTEIDLPAITLAHPSRLLIAGGATAYLTHGLTGGGDKFGLPVFEIATNAVVTTVRNTRFINLDLHLYGLLEIPNDASDSGGLYFGYALAGETTYFAMTAIGGTISIPKHTGLTYAWKCFAAPQWGGSVNVRGPILLKDVKFNRNRDGSSYSAYNGFYLGYGNPTNQPFEIILDNTQMPIGRLNYVGGAATVRCINGGQLRSATPHSGVATIFEMKEAGRIVAEGLNSGIYYSHTGIADNTPHSPLAFTSNAREGKPQVELVNGAFIAAHETSGNGNAVLAVSNGVCQIPMLPYVAPELSKYLPSGDPRDWMTDPFTGLREVRVAAGSDIYLASANVLGYTATFAASLWNRDVKLANVPITGAGGLVMTNCTPGYTFRTTVVSANNTATGEAKAVCGTGGDATTLLFSDGANWAGTVVAGNVALTNVTDGSAAATVNFGSLRMDGEFPVRIWATTNDMVNIATSLQDGGGDFRPVLMPGRAALEPGESFTFGTFAAGATIPRRIGHWIISSTPTANPDFVTVSLRYMPPATRILLR